ncbi:hypothetical protein QZH41_008429 [Actinostola sp. cb2023]|nr:hypothetical protein QZH41_008429 [Actinostola sp. cb2023]
MIALVITARPVTTTTCKDDALVIDTGNKKHTKCAKSEELEEFATTTNKLAIRFYSGKVQFENRRYTGGFALTFTTEKAAPTDPDSESICPTRHIKKKKRSGTILSPGFPSNYGNNQDCKVRIPIPDNFQMNVWFSDFSLQKSPICQNDKLSIKDEHGGHKMCGGGRNKLPGLQELKGSLARFRFKTDSSVNMEGFRLHYNMTLTQGHCMCTTGLNYICMLNFNRKVRRLWHRIKFSIKTSQKQGLIMFSKGKYRDYIYIGVHDGKIFYRSDLGTGSNIAITHGMVISDNKWHYVEIRRRKRSLSIAVDNGKAVGSARTKGNFNQIDLEGSIGFFLGTPPQLTGMPDFVGCIRDFTVDGREPLANAFVAKPEYPSHGMLRMTMC